MIVAIDGYEANAGNRVGIGRYSVELLSHMERLLANGSSVFSDARVYVPGKVRAHMPKQSGIWRYRQLTPRRFWTFLALPWALTTDRPRADVVFSPTHYVPRFIGIPKVMAVMDVSYLLYPELFKPQDLHKLVHWTRYSVEHAEAIVTISEFSKNAIIKAYNVPEHKVTVAYPALPDAFGVSTTMGDIKKYRLPKKYILSVGTLQPRKNYARLIEAFGSLPDTDVSLVIVGKKGWLYEEILETPAKLGLTDRVRFLDFVPDEDLPALYRGAVCFALPSLYEGFGLPVLEAMQHGVPVVVSNASSLPEIAGEAGIYVDPSDVKSIAQGIMTALSEHGTKSEKARVTLGEKLAQTFNWDTSAKAVLSVLEDVAKGTHV